MTARTAGFLTRAQCGLKPPRSRSTRVSPGRGGVAVHWGGPGAAPATLDGAIKLWRSWQTMHMAAPRGWADIAYSVGVTQTGHVLAGRGYGVRTAAQGTNDGNDRYVAVVWIGGEDSTPSQAALDAIEWVVQDFRSQGAGLDVYSHRHFHTTTCAGSKLTAHAGALHRRSVASVVDELPAPPAEPVAGDAVLRLTAPQTEGPAVLAWQGDLWRRAAIGVGAHDGHYGPVTEAASRRFQAAAGLQVDGVVGTKTRAAMTAVPTYPGWDGNTPLWMTGGSRGHHVAAVQQRLRDRGWVNSKGRDLAVDGSYGPETARVVDLFAREFRQPTGGVGSEVWVALWARGVR